MRLIATLGIGLGAATLAAGTLGAAPAEAQRHGYHHDRGYGHDGGYRHHGGYGYRGGYGYGRGYYGGRGGYYRHGYYGGRGGYYRHGYYGRPRVVCRWSRFNGRRCFRAF